jgi:hypothetical protein
MAIANLFNLASFPVTDDQIVGIKNSLQTIDFPDGFQEAANFQVNRTDAEFTDEGFPRIQMAFDAADLRILLADADAVMVTVGQDGAANFKICFQKMKNQGRNIFTLENTGLSNYEAEGGSTYPVNGFPPPPPTAT